MSLDDFLSPDRPEVGLQKYARDLVTQHEDLYNAYQSDPIDFNYRINKVLDSFVSRYSVLLDKDALRELTLPADMSQGALEKSLREPKTKRGKLLLGVLLGLPSFYSTYRNVASQTQDSSVAGLEVSKDVLESFLPFGETLTQKGGYVLEKLLGSTPIQREINYKLRDAIFTEFGLSTLQDRNKVAARSYKGVQNRDKNIISARNAFV